MANKKTRGPDKAKTNTDNIVVKRQEDAPDIVKQPPVFTDDSSFDIIGLGIKEENILYLCDTSGDVIEWDIKDGKLLKKTSVAVDGMKKFCSFYYPGNGMFLLSTPAKNTNGSSLWIVNSTSEREIFSEDIRKEPQSVAFGCDQGNGSLVIGALNYQCNGVLVKDMNSGAEKKHMTDKRKFTCIALHKEKLIMATGDISGRILIWHDFVNQIRPVKTVYHWHTLAVSSGEYLYSGGSEKVMVKWRLEAIRIIDSTNKINRAIFGGLVKHDPIRGLEDGESKKESVMPTGLVFDPRTQGIFFNSQAGFLQLFDPLRSSMIYNMDIANRNVLTDERNTIIGNAEVLRVAVSPTGDFRKMMPTAASFSEDGSLLAIAFQDTVTSWDPMTINLNTTLSHNLIEGRS
ncbi:WD repeat-containing protein 75-like [Daphnia pulicaria]|uniref:WD repeat-containing protein 75-like n=1 Tax=Daphnia pulicaria TaxID=35523 RepID=UPI001EEB4C04|nr:WD repeat-containing protein 75-like [Daphnia pulicaria]